MKTYADIQKEIDDKNAELDNLIDTFKKTIERLAARGFKLFDAENEEYYLTGNVKYDRKDNKFKFECDKEDY